MLKNACDIFIANEVIKNQDESEDDEFDDILFQKNIDKLLKIMKIY